MFPAKDGDCFLVSIDTFNILIDGGHAETYSSHVRHVLMQLSARGEQIDLLIATHIDRDHIGGLQAFVDDNGQAECRKICQVRDVWYNTYAHLPRNTAENSRNLSREETEILKSYISLHNSQCTSNGSEYISGKQGLTLAYGLLHNQYSLNRHSCNRTISTETAHKITISDIITIRVLSPSNEQLSMLEKNWRHELQSKKWTFNFTDDELFNSAMETYLLSYKPHEVLTELISYTQDDLQPSVVNLLNETASPDTSITNASSIAFIIETNEKKLLFLGDAHESQIILEIQKLIDSEGYDPYFDIVKVSHHGSLKNADKLFGLIDGHTFLISTDGARHPDHPHLATMARIISRPTKTRRRLILNYDNGGYRYFANEELMKLYNYSIEINADAEDITE